MEESLDRIASGEFTLLNYMNTFYSNLKNIVDNVDETGLATDIPEKICPECGKALVVRRSRFGKLFLACCGYPACKYTESV
jgi:DNA topoisomerase-1